MTCFSFISSARRNEFPHLKLDPILFLFRFFLFVTKVEKPSAQNYFMNIIQIFKILGSLLYCVHHHVAYFFWNHGDFIIKIAIKFKCSKHYLLRVVQG